MKYKASLYTNNYLYIPVKVRRLLGIYNKNAKLSFAREARGIQITVLG